MRPSPQQEGAHRHEEGAARRVTPPLGAAADGLSPPPGGGGGAAAAVAGPAAAGRPTMPKQLAALQDLAPADSVSWQGCGSLMGIPVL